MEAKRASSYPANYFSIGHQRPLSQPFMSEASKGLVHQEIELESAQTLLSPDGEGANTSSQLQEDMAVKYGGSDERPTDALTKIVALGSISTLTAITWVIVLTHNPTALGWFALHPLLQTLSLVFFTYGIVTLQPTSHFQPKEKAAGLIRHQLAIFLLGFPAILVGTWAVWHNKNLRNADHYTTWHGTFGGLCLLWMLGQIVLGAGSVWFDGKLFGGGAKAKALWKYHRASGYILFPLMLLTVHLGGAWSHWGEKNIAWVFRFIGYTLAPLLLFASIAARVRLSKMRFF